jgi:hypothetical protein
MDEYMDARRNQRHLMLVDVWTKTNMGIRNLIKIECLWDLQEDNPI